MEWARLLFAIGAAAFVLLVPVLAGFTAFAIADRPGLAPGFVGGAIAAASAPASSAASPRASSAASPPCG